MLRCFTVSYCLAEKHRIFKFQGPNVGIVLSTLNIVKHRLHVCLVEVEALAGDADDGDVDTEEEYNGLQSYLLVTSQ